MIGELYPGEFEAMEHNGRMDALEQEPCDVFDKYGNYKYPNDVELTEPNTATSMPCEDAISRDAVLLLIQRVKEQEKINYMSLLNLTAEVRKLPPVNPQPKTGHWILTSDDDYEYCTCSECGYQNGENWMIGSQIKYCPNCGRSMIEPQESEGWMEAYLEDNKRIQNIPSVPAIPIPEGATNGDVIKALFPSEYEALPVNIDRASWWNAPYKRGDKE